MKRLLLLLLPLLAVLLTGCNNSDEPQVISSKVTITPEGGVYKLKNGVVLTVPQGAVSGKTKVQVDYSEDLDASIGRLPCDIHGRVRFSPEGLTFRKPIEVTMPLNQPVADSETEIVYWSKEDEMWYITDLGEVKGKEVKFQIEHFSDYASVNATWNPVFQMMDQYVSGTATETVNNESPAMKNFLEEVMWEQIGLKDLRAAMYAGVGGQLVSVCAQPCGLEGDWKSKDTVTSAVRQSMGSFKEKSKDNIITCIGLHESHMTAHMRQMVILEERTTIIDRSIEIYWNACPVNLSGEASPSSIEKGKKSTVTITAHCEGDPLSGQLIQLQYSPELSCDVVNKKTDENGQITITVKGEEEGQGIVYAKAVSAANSDYVTEIEIPVQVGGGEHWRITMDLKVHTNTSFEEDYYNLHTENYKVSGGEQSLDFGFTYVFDMLVQEAVNTPEAHTYKMTGTASAKNHQGDYKISLPDFSQGGSYHIVEGVFTTQTTQSLTATPVFRDIEIPCWGACYTQDGARKYVINTYPQEMFGGLDDLDDEGDDYGMGDLFNSAKKMYQFNIDNAYFILNIIGTWTTHSSNTFDGSSSTDNGTFKYGTPAWDESNAHLSVCTLGGVVVHGADLKEGTVPINVTTDETGSYNSIKAGGYEIESGISLHVGIYHDEPGAWLGQGHWTLTGSIKTENLDKKQ